MFSNTLASVFRKVSDMQRFLRCFPLMLKHEGGYVNHPRDPGGITNLGVTKATYEGWRGRPVTVAEMKALTPKDVQPLYYRLYWREVDGPNLPAGLDMCVFDFGVNAGPRRAKRYLQLMVGAKADGIIGPKTRGQLSDYLEQFGVDTAIRNYQDLRRKYYRKLPTYGTFGKGWMNRVTAVEREALEML